MNGIDIALIVLLVGVVLLALRKAVRSKGSCSCSSGGCCSGCCASCPGCAKKDGEQKS